MKYDARNSKNLYHHEMENIKSKQTMYTIQITNTCLGIDEIVFKIRKLETDIWSLTTKARDHYVITCPVHSEDIPKLQLNIMGYLNGYRMVSSSIPLRLCLNSSVIL